MTELSDEQRVLAALGEITLGMLEFDRETQRRIYELIGGFFGYDAPPPSGQR